MNRYGQSIVWSALTAPHIFSGQCTAYSYVDALTRQLIEDQVGDNMAAVLHSSKAELNFEAKITDQSTNFLDLSAGAAITVSGISSGVVLATRAVERWVLGEPKMASITATHFPHIVQVTPAAAGTNLDAFTPDQASLSIVTPGDKIRYGTFGLEHASGIVHGLTIEQQLIITEDEPSPAGTILGAASHGYMRIVTLDILATGNPPVKGSALSIINAPDHAADHLIERVETRFAEKRGKMYSITAFWIDPFTAS